MIRFAWLQARTQTAVVAAGVTVVVALGVITGPHLAHLYATNLAACRAQRTCAFTSAAFSADDYFLYGALGNLLLVLPAVVGLFWGAPLVARELESGTYRLAWTQGVTRRRWLATRVAVVGLAALALTGLMSLAVSWSARSVDLVKADQFRYFDERDLAPVGYAAFAFALGLLVGLLMRRVLPAVGTTLVVFVAARFADARWVRPHLVAAAHENLTLSGSGGLGFAFGPQGVLVRAEPPRIPNAYVLSGQLVDKTGHVIGGTTLHQFLVAHCPTLLAGAGIPKPGGPTLAPAPAAAQGAMSTCTAQLASVYHQSVAYIAPSRYWALQWRELGLWLAAAAVLVAAAVWAIRRNPS